MTTQVIARELGDVAVVYNKAEDLATLGKTDEAIGALYQAIRALTKKSDEEYHEDLDKDQVGN